MLPPTGKRAAFTLALVLLALGRFQLGGADPDAPLPTGVMAVWDIATAYREASVSRERVSVNGLWRFQPAPAVAQHADHAEGTAVDVVPVSQWGFFKVPGCWPGISDYMQHDAQTVYPHPAWSTAPMGAVTAAWYQREITVPATWSGRRVVLRVDDLASYATVFIDGHASGTLRFPGGEVELSPPPTAGSHVLSLHVIAMPLKAVMLSYSDTSSAKEVRGAVERRGLCGDVWLSSTPAAARIGDIAVHTSVASGTITIGAALDGLAGPGPYILHARIADHGTVVTEFASPVFAASDLTDGTMAISAAWTPSKRWDIHTPGNVFQLSLTLSDATGAVLDAALPVRFGFRELRIAGRDLLLNGTRIYLSALPIDNAAISAATATYAAAKETLLRLKAIGINCVYTHNYGCEPGTHLAFEEILAAADDVGMLVSLSQPHFGHYDWTAPDAEVSNGYARHAAYYVGIARNHPSVVFYSMSHNATGYNEDINPDMMDGHKDNRDSWSRNNATLALRAEAIVHRLDPDRIVYHHSGGDLGAMYTVNFYTNFVPIQEMSDWFEHWATAGSKPMFTCEYGVPFTWDWTMYRGWYKGQRSFGSARVPWEFCLAEWDAQFLGDRAFAISDQEKANLRYEAKQFRAGATWFRWDYPYAVGANVFDDRFTVIARYITDNWRAFRTWGLSGNSPWDFETYWRPRDGVERGRVTLPVDWRNLQRPGFSPDYIEQPYQRMDLAYQRDDWIPTAAGLALLRNNMPLLGYLAGPSTHVTSKEHVFIAGQAVDKQLVIINNSRDTVSCSASWALHLPQEQSGSATVVIPTGEQRRLPVHAVLPEGLGAGTCDLTASFAFAGGETQTDAVTITVVPPPPPLPAAAATGPPRIALFDPKGETTALLGRLGVRAQAVQADADLAAYDLLIVGKAALTPDGPGPDILRVRSGLKVVVFEQGAETLERRLGFRIAEYGLRQVFARVPDHPLLSGISVDQLHDWRGDATLLPPRMHYVLNEHYNGAPSVTWCGLEATRLWRCGCRGTVASVLIEKPACGDFLAIIEGGYSLQYSPLLEYREGSGMVLFCQMDVTGRSEDEPAAGRLARNIIAYALAWTGAPRRAVVYAGEPSGQHHLEAMGVTVAAYRSGALAPEALLVATPGAGQALGAEAPAIGAWLKAGGHLLAIALDQQAVNALLPGTVTMATSEHIAAVFPAAAAGSLLAGVGPADVHNRDPRELPLVRAGAQAAGDGVLATIGDGVVFCQLAPWQFDYTRQYNVKRTFRRTAVLVSRLLANLGAASTTPILARFHAPANAAQTAGAPAASTPRPRWLDGLYLDTPEEMDDPYRFFGW
jgi:hypothetical protein